MSTAATTSDQTGNNGSISFPAFLPAKRYAGFVDVPEYKMEGQPALEDWNSTKILVPRSEDSCSQFPDFENMHGRMPGPTRLQRTITMNGNIVVLEPDGPSSQAFWLQRKVGQSSLGIVRVAYKLRRSPNTSTDNNTNNNSSRAWQLDINEEGRPSLVAISMINRTTIVEGAIDGDVLARERVWNELEGLQRIAKYGTPEETHVVGTSLVGACSSFIYIVLPYCPDGSLLQYCQSKGSLKEPVARFLFQQILQVRD